MDALAAGRRGAWAPCGADGAALLWLGGADARAAPADGARAPPHLAAWRARVEALRGGLRRAHALFGRQLGACSRVMVLRARSPRALVLPKMPAAKACCELALPGPEGCELWFRPQSATAAAASSSSSGADAGARVAPRALTWLPTEARCSQELAARRPGSPAFALVAVWFFDAEDVPRRGGRAASAAAPDSDDSDDSLAARISRLEDGYAALIQGVG